MSHRRSSGNADCKVYVGDLSRDVSERDLEKVFKQFGSLRSVWVARNPPGFAFIEFDDDRDAADAIKELDGTEVCGSRVRVRAGSDYPSRSRGPPRGGGGSRRPYDPNDRCFRCNQRGHYAYDCEKYNSGGGGGGDRRGRSYSRSRSRERRRSYSRSRSPERDRRDRRRSRSRS